MSSSSSAGSATAADCFAFFFTSAIILAMRASSSSLDEIVTVLSFLGRPRFFFSASLSVASVTAVASALRGRPRPRAEALRSDITGQSPASAGPTRVSRTGCFLAAGVLAAGLLAAAFTTALSLVFGICVHRSTMFSRSLTRLARSATTME